MQLIKRHPVLALVTVAWFGVAAAGPVSADFRKDTGPRAEPQRGGTAVAEATAVPPQATESARIEALARQRANAASRRVSARAAPPEPAGTLLATPTKGRKSSAYGMRLDPIRRVRQMHAGVDIAAAGGTPIHAAADGTVTRAGWNGGYGNYTCLSHGAHQGRKLSTCYAHQSRILVRKGQAVRRGELIGRVGTTGASTGNHLHFEVRLDGVPADPVPYLPRLPG